MMGDPRNSPELCASTKTWFKSCVSCVVELRDQYLCGGTNNLEVNQPARIGGGVAALCEEIHRQKPPSPIRLLAAFPRDAQRENQTLDETNVLFKKLDQRPSVVFKDIDSVLLNDQGQLTRDIMPDLLHPGPKGHRRRPRATENEVSHALGDTPVRE